MGCFFAIIHAIAAKRKPANGMYMQNFLEDTVDGGFLK